MICELFLLDMQQYGFVLENLLDKAASMTLAKAYKKISMPSTFLNGGDLVFTYVEVVRNILNFESNSYWETKTSISAKKLVLISLRLASYTCKG